MLAVFDFFRFVKEITSFKMNILTTKHRGCHWSLRSLRWIFGSNALMSYWTLQITTYPSLFTLVPLNGIFPYRNRLVCLTKDPCLCQLHTQIVVIFQIISGLWNRIWGSVILKYPIVDINYWAVYLLRTFLTDTAMFSVKLSVNLKKRKYFLPNSICFHQDILFIIAATHSCHHCLLSFTEYDSSKKKSKYIVRKFVFSWHRNLLRERPSNTYTIFLILFLCRVFDGNRVCVFIILLLFLLNYVSLFRLNVI